MNVTVEQARSAGVCRVCVRPIHHPVEAVYYTERDENLTNKGEYIVTRNGEEYAHSACVTEGIYERPANLRERRQG